MQNLSKETKRKKLLNRGVYKLTHQGYFGTGLQEILDEVNIPKGSFYAYFGSKESFCIEVIDHYIGPVIDQLQRGLNNVELNGFTALTQHLNELIEMYESKNFSGGCLLGNLMGELGNNSVAIRLALLNAVKRYEDLFTQALSSAQQDHLVRDDLPPNEMAKLLINSWQGALLRMQIERSVEPLVTCRDNLLLGYFRS